MEYSPSGNRDKFPEEKPETSEKYTKIGCDRVNRVSNQPKTSRSSSFFKLLYFGRHSWKLLIALLSLFHVAEAYISVSMSGMCRLNGSKSLRLSPEAAVSLLLDASSNVRSSCRMELIAPETHSISLLFTRRKSSREKKTDSPVGEKARLAKCPLVVSFPLLRPEEVKMCLDLCSEEAFKSVEHFTDLLPSRVTLEWTPNVKNLNEILASEIVVAGVGRGREVCSRPGQFSCRNMGYPVYCIHKKLTCDGKRNCPFEGRDEDKELCSSEGNLEKGGVGLKDARIGGGWEFLASEFLKKLSSRENGQLKKFDLPSSTEKSTVLWSDDGTNHTRDSESLPDVLKHYGPWGYLMLGMLICGTVLMFCGLWECCCRRPKALVSNAVGPALLIINQGAQQNEVETPPTPGPPRYEELDQPPSYSALFPSTKPPDVLNGSANPLPVTLPVVHSLSIVRSNFNMISSSTNSPGDRTCSAPPQPPPPSDVYTIDIQNANCLDIRGNNPSPK